MTDSSLSTFERPGTVLGIPGEISPRSLALRPGLSFEEWNLVGLTLRTIGGAAMWWIGDWYLYGEHHYGENAAQAVGDETGYSAKTVQQAAWVASRFESSRRLENLPWSTHLALAGIEDEEKRCCLLQAAATEQWTVRQTRERVRDLKQPAVPLGEPAVVDQPTSVEMGALMLTLYPATGLLIIQRRDRREDDGLVLDRADLTPEARALLREFVDGAAG